MQMRQDDDSIISYLTRGFIEGNAVTPFLPEGGTWLVALDQIGSNFVQSFCM